MAATRESARVRRVAMAHSSCSGRGSSNSVFMAEASMTERAHSAQVFATGPSAVVRRQAQLRRVGAEHLDSYLASLGQVGRAIAAVSVLLVGGVVRL